MRRSDSAFEEEAGLPHIGLERRLDSLSGGELSRLALVKAWLKQNGLPDLEVTNTKDFKMIELWDDRAVQVSRNSGQPLNEDVRTAGATKPAIRIVARRSGGFMTKLRTFLAL